jgi:hypothetical protein
MGTREAPMDWGREAIAFGRSFSKASTCASASGFGREHFAPHALMYDIQNGAYGARFAD